MLQHIKSNAEISVTV